MVIWVMIESRVSVLLLMVDGCDMYASNEIIFCRVRFCFILLEAMHFSFSLSTIGLN